MIKKILKVAVVIALVLALFSSCVSDDEDAEDELPSDYLMVPLSFDMNLDPSGDWYFSDMEVFSVIYDPLYIFDADGGLELGLAAAMPVISEDEMVYKIKLKEGVFFHDNESFPGGKGREVKAEDVVYSFKRVVQPDNVSGLWSLLQGRIQGFDEYKDGLEDGNIDFDAEIAGFRAVGDYELEINLVKPYRPITYVLAMPYFSVVPQEAVEFYGEDFKHNPVGSGPFSLVSFEEKKILVERVEGHFRNPESPEGELPAGIAFRRFDNDWNAFKDGDLDVFLVSADRLKAYVNDDFEIKEELAENGYGIYPIEEASRSFLNFNYNDPLMQNLHLRKAIAYAINWEAYLDFEDKITAAFIPGPTPGNTDLQWEYNVEKAKEELALAGYPNGEGLPELTYRAKWPSRLFLGGMIIDNLDQIGIKMVLERVETDELEEAHMSSQSWVLDFPDASSMLAVLHSNAHPPDGTNYGYFSNPEYDAMFEAALDMDDDERVEQYEKIGQWIYDNVIVIPYRQTFLYNGLSQRIKSIETNAVDLFRWEQVEFKVVEEESNPEA